MLLEGFDLTCWAAGFPYSKLPAPFQEFTFERGLMSANVSQVCSESAALL